MEDRTIPNQGINFQPKVGPERKVDSASELRAYIDFLSLDATAAQAIQEINKENSRRRIIRFDREHPESKTIGQNLPIPEDLAKKCKSWFCVIPAGEIEETSLQLELGKDVEFTDKLTREGFAAALNNALGLSGHDRFKVSSDNIVHCITQTYLQSARLANKMSEIGIRVEAGLLYMLMEEKAKSSGSAVPNPPAPQVGDKTADMRGGPPPKSWKNEL